MTDKEKWSEVGRRLAIHIAQTYGGQYLDKNNVLHKNVNGEWVGKPAVQVKANGHTGMVWVDDIK